jgi:YD repeat-containing protein
MTAASTATWRQLDDPDASAGGTAICPPSITAPSSPSGILQGCTIVYLDPQGLTVNTADYSQQWNVTTTEYDPLGNPTRALSADDRAEALDPAHGAGAALGLPTDTATAAEDLSTINVYTPDKLDGQPDLTQTFGPYHQVELADGDFVAARQVTATGYDDTDPNKTTDGHPTDGHGQYLAQHLVMSTVEAASQSAAPVATNLTDSRETDYAYNNGSDTSGWTFGIPLQTTVVMSHGPNIVSTVKLDPDTGRTIATSQPSDTAGNGPGTTVTEYYTTGSNADSDCANKPLWAGEVCKTLPAAPLAAEGLPGLVSTLYASYDYLGRPVVVKDIVKDADDNTQTRVTTTSYGFNSPSNTYSNDTASVAVTGGVGIAVPTVTDSYDQVSGLQTGVSAAAAAPNAASATATSYDGFGEVVPGLVELEVAVPRLTPTVR